MRPTGWLPEWDEAAKTIVRDVLAEPVPEIEEAPAQLGSSRNWRFVGDPRPHPAPSEEAARPYLTDWWRRCRVSDLAEERGWPSEVQDLAWLLLPYRSVQFRWGWEAFSAIQEGKTTEAAIEEWARRERERFLEG